MNKIFIISCFSMAILFLTSCYPNTTPENNTAPLSESGKELFEQNCARCHGTDGTAGINNAANLQLSRADTISIIHLVQQGRKEMPSFEGILNENDIHKIASYVHTLRK